MTFQTLLSNLKKTQAAHDAAMKGVAKRTKKDIAAHLAAALPKGFAAEWTQCNPSYRDGEPCRFRASPPALFRADPDDEAFPDRVFFIDDTALNDVPGLTRAHVRAFVTAWKALPIALLEKTFGDGTKVRVNSNGSFTLNDYLGD